jgi:hypothetical protein
MLDTIDLRNAEDEEAGRSVVVINGQAHVVVLFVTMMSRS